MGMWRKSKHEIIYVSFREPKVIAVCFVLGLFYFILGTEFFKLLYF